MEIRNLKFWQDVGFQDGAMELPRIGAVLPAPSITVDEPLHPKRDAWMSTLKVPGDYLVLQTMTYMGFTVVMNDGSEREFYGWVDDVAYNSDTELSNAVISWHMDLWRMWVSQAVFGSGMVTRRPEAVGEPLPPQGYPYRYLKQTERFELPNIREELAWVYISVTTGTTISEVSTYCYPVSKESDLLMPMDDTKGDFPSYYSTILGTLDEDLGVDPMAISSCFVCPYPPAPVTREGFRIGVSGWEPVRLEQGKGSVLKPSISLQPIAEMHMSVSCRTDDANNWEICGFDNEVVGAMPWGLEVVELAYRVVAGTSAAYVQIRGRTADSRFEDAHALGLCWTVPMVPVPITSNASSSYMYSGARDADRRALQLAADRSRVSGDVGALASTASGAASGALMGAAGGPVGMGIGAIVGGATSAISGAVSSEAGYRYNAGEFLDREMDIREYRAANQTNGLLMQGNVLDFAWFGSFIRVRHMVKDSYSLQMRYQDMNQYGVRVSEATADCQTLVQAGGPLKIVNLVVTGPIPKEARDYIKARLSNGVIIK